MTTSTLDRQVRRADRTIQGVSWVIVAVVATYSLMTSTPLVRAHSAWTWSAPLLGIAVDAAFVMALQADAVLARHGATAGTWPIILRWWAGLASVGLNVGAAALTRDWVGVGIHTIAPVLLLTLGEAAPAYRRAMASITTAQDCAPTAHTAQRADLHIAQDTAQYDTSTAQDCAPTAHLPAHTAQDCAPTAQDRDEAVRSAWLQGLSTRAAALQIGMSPSWVRGQYAALTRESADDDARVERAR